VDFDLRAATHLLVVCGSRGQGLHGPRSDVDVRGFCVPPRRYLLGFDSRFEQADTREDIAPLATLLSAEEARVEGLDGSVYALAKLARLCVDCNPNLLEVLFCREDEVRLCTPVGRALRDARVAFLSERARHSFAGYAAGQLRRIEGHRKWLLDPPSSPPTREEFGLPEAALIPANQRLAAEAAVSKQLDSWEIDFGDLPASQVTALRGRIAHVLGEVLVAGQGRWTAAARTVGLDDDLIEVMKRERTYQNARRHWKQYCTWKRQRNPARAALEAAHGYDTKHAAHLVRLLRCGREILEEGTLAVWRGDRDAGELRAIRAGAWSYETLIEQVAAEESALAAVVEEGRSVVPKRPDLTQLEALTVELTEQALAATQRR